MLVSANLSGSIVRVGSVRRSCSSCKHTYRPVMTYFRTVWVEVRTLRSYSTNLHHIQRTDNSTRTPDSTCQVHMVGSRTYLIALSHYCKYQEDTGTRSYEEFLPDNNGRPDTREDMILILSDSGNLHNTFHIRFVRHVRCSIPLHTLVDGMFPIHKSVRSDRGHLATSRCTVSRIPILADSRNQAHIDQTHSAILLYHNSILVRIACTRSPSSSVCHFHTDRADTGEVWLCSSDSSFRAYRDQRFRCGWILVRLCWNRTHSSNPVNNILPVLLRCSPDSTCHRYTEHTLKSEDKKRSSALKYTFLTTIKICSRNYWVGLNP